jgi:hypothetical protein
MKSTDARQPEPWTPEELAHKLRRFCETEFRTGPLEHGKERNSFSFWVILPAPEGLDASMAVVRVSPSFEVKVDVRGKGDKKIETIFRDSLAFAAAKAGAR